MLAAALKLVLPAVLDKTLGGILDLVKQHQANQITREQLLNEMGKMLLSSVVEVEKAMADAIKATFASFMGTVQATPIVARAYVAVLLSQTTVLVWVQVGVPFLTWMTGTVYPDAGTTINWAYALVAGLCGLGPLVMKTSPADLKKLVGK
jgi:hypothetical protein